MTRLAVPNPFSRTSPTVDKVVQLVARFGYGARGFVYLSIGLLTLMAALDMVDSSVGTGGAVGALARQPFGRTWLILLGLGLWAFVLWRVLQAVFDADREGTRPKALMLRAGQAVSGLFYGLLAATVFELLDEVGADPSADDIAENQQKASMVLDLPFGDWLLIGVGLTIASVGIGNILKGIGADFGEDLACTLEQKRWFTVIARAGYVARGLAYLPLALFVALAGLRARAESVTSFGASLDALEAQPGGSWMLGLTALGLMAFGAFAFVEARFRRIRTPDLNPLNG
ncbi:DUF1206 domain-containing protein [Brevundimonas variabilis]|uniref:DUF1206 domain-containing protein n=1 Tax=Brevundimonas variabilis TaxID=74312 RepID=A0A7W9FFH3_9CAUL|nr:DUF1206 domain-containing protein [Brevundimonas variabilis]MBB5747310.1 hypothetical protein [Brevundimonas variabilis]